MYIGTPSQVIDGLPSLINNIKMMYAIARYYGTNERMTRLFFKITNQMVTLCKEHILEDGPNLWAHDKERLIGKLNLSIALHDAYKQQYGIVRAQLAEQKPKPKQFDFNPERVFGKLGVFVKRCGKLVEMLSTIGQFEELAKNKHIDGMDLLIRRFFKAVDEFKRKPYDLLDYQQNQFDRDFLEFNVMVHDVETSLQDFIDKSFENITSTEASLRLLTQFQEIMHRDALKRRTWTPSTTSSSETTAPISRRCRRSTRSRNTIRHCHVTRRPWREISSGRDNCCVASRSRSTLCQERNDYEVARSKRIVKIYNKVATALMTFETLWYQAWTRGIERSKAGLRATLIVKHPETKALLVNFDKDIMQLIRESKYMLRLDVEVPESARMVLAQEDKFKRYFNQLTHLINEHQRITGEIAPITLPLMRPLLEDLELTMLPGLTDLTWTSVNIDMYLARVHKKMSNIQELVRKMNDILHNRIDSNLKEAARVMLVSLPEDQSATPDEFLAMQNRVVKDEGAALMIKSEEVRRACDDLIELVASQVPSNEWGIPVELDADAVGEFKATLCAIDIQRGSPRYSPIVRQASTTRRIARQRRFPIRRAALLRGDGGTRGALRGTAALRGRNSARGEQRGEEDSQGESRDSALGQHRLERRRGERSRGGLR